MAVKFFLIILLSAAYNHQAKADNNRICECNTEQDIKDNENLWDLLKRLEKLASEAPEEQKIDYAVPPGLLDQFECNCDEKSRKKRKVAEGLEYPAEVAQKNAEKDDVEEIREKRHLVKLPDQFEIDLRCPSGTYWIAQARTCVPRSGFDEWGSEEQ